MSMKLSDLSRYLQQRLAEPLPGNAAHELLRATPIEPLPDFRHKLPPKPGSVMILFYEADGEIWFPLIKRPDYPGAHGGQVSLPGGKTEPGENALQCALRECHEEIGVPPATVRVWGTLSEFFVIPSNFLVTPVIGEWPEPGEFAGDPVEVSRVMKASLRDLLKPDAVRYQEILAAGRYRMNAPHFLIDGEIVWGATAMMLQELRAVVLEGTDLGHI